MIEMKKKIQAYSYSDKKSKYLVENDTDDFIDNLKNNLIPELEEVWYETII